MMNHHTTVHRAQQTPVFETTPGPPHLFIATRFENQTPPQPVDKGLRRGTEEGTIRPHALNPRPQPPLVESTLTISEQLDRDWHRLNDWYNEQRALGVKP